MAIATPSPMELYGDPQVVLRRVMAAVDGIEAHESDPVPDYAEGALYYRVAPNGREICLYRLLAGTVRITVGDPGQGCWDDAWCYSHPSAGLLAAASWDGEGDPPDGWFRHIGSARRRPEGDPTREYVER